MTGLQKWHEFLKKYRKITNEKYKTAQKKASVLYKIGIRDTVGIMQVLVENAKLKNATVLSEADKARVRLNSGDMSGAYKLVELREIFTKRDIQNFKKAIIKNKGEKAKKIIALNTSDGKTKYIPLRVDTWGSIEPCLANGCFGSVADFIDYSAIKKTFIKGVDSISVNTLSASNFNNKDGGFFRYINTTNEDLTRYQIIRETDNQEILKKHCLIHTLELYGIKEDLLNIITLAYDHPNVNYPMSQLIKVANIIQKRIIIHKYRNKDNKIEKIVYGKLFSDVIDIALFENHYFIYENSGFSYYSANNYNHVKDIDNFKNIIKKVNQKYKRKKTTKRCTSLQLISMFYKQKLFDGDHHLLFKFDEYHHNIKKNLDIPLTNIQNEQRLFTSGTKDSDNCKYSNDEIYFADFESMVNVGYHEGFLSGISKIDNNEVKIFEMKPNNKLNWLYGMLDYVCDNTAIDKIPKIYYHNVKYDFSLISQHLYVKNKIEKDGMLYRICIRYRKRDILLVDSYKLISVPLRKFNDMFGLDKKLNKQEAIGYTFYNKENYNLPCVKIDSYLEHVKKSEKNIFLKNVKNKIFDYDSVNNTFNHMKYYKYYLYYDVRVLKAGMAKFHEKMEEMTGLNAYDSLTISSLSNEYMKIKGSFDGVYEVKGNLREFLSKAVYGGRVACLEKTKKKIINKKIADYDACSLYPSAIHRMCNEVGVPIGMAKRIDSNNLNKKDLDKKNYYVVKVRINKINKKQQIPFIAYRNNGDDLNKKQKGPRLDYINEIPKKLDYVECIIDKITLEDYITFHDIKYDIIDGVYWNEGTNKIFGEVVKELYDNRLIEKAKLKDCLKSGDYGSAAGHNCMQTLIKLMMNSAYGKTITKKTTTQNLLLRNGEKFKQYISNHFNSIKSYTEYNKFQMSITKSAYDDGYNMAHVGTLVLSYSKRIMNEVMNTANDNNFPIYYTDTDSIHMNYDDVEKLEKLYNEKYHKNLKGKNMGNFHIDFDLKGAISEIYSIKTIILGKKCYLDCLESTNEKGDIIHGYHYRMKGVTKEGILNQIGKKYKDIVKYENIEKLYEGLANSESVEFLLNPKGEKVMFEYVDNHVRTRRDFIREVSF